MADFTSVDLLAKELKDASGHRRVTAIENCVTAGKALVQKGEKITPATIAEMVTELGLKSPSKQTLYNAKDVFDPLLSALSKLVQPAVILKPQSSGSDTSDILNSLNTPRLKSMFTDIVNERDALRGENRRLSNFVRELKTQDILNNKDISENTAIISTNEAKTINNEAIRNFIEVMENEGYDFEDDDIYNDGRPLLVQSFVKLIQDLK